MKKIIVSLMLLLPLCMAAQEIKIAYVNTNDIFMVMPEVTNMTSQLDALDKQTEDFLVSMQKEYQTKYTEYMQKQDSLPDNIKAMHIQEIEALRARIENYYESAQQDRQRKYEELLMPIQDKLQKAIDQVGEENGYTYIINPQALLYKGRSAVDATDKVKAKLGLN